MGSWTGIAEQLSCRANAWVAASTAQMNFNMLCQIGHVKHISQIITSYHKLSQVITSGIHIF